MKEIILGRNDIIVPFVAARIGQTPFTNCASMGLVEDGKIIAGVVYDCYTGANCNIHVGAVPGRRWMTREFLYAVFDYPFRQLDLKRITGPVERSNHEALRFDRHLGFQLEGVMKDAAPSGDILLLVLWRDNCRYWHRDNIRKAA